MRREDEPVRSLLIVDNDLGFADQNGHAVLHLFANAIDKFATQPVAEARAFTGRAEHEQSTHAAGDDVFDKKFQAGRVEFIAIAQRRNHRRNNSSQR